ncbi:hypothetical protein STEG23_015807, partial [Scotinomys teguina]
VKELREKAESYRKRVQGTHFSRDHLNQILSDSNCCWDVSSTTSSEGTISSNIRALDLAGDLTSHKTPQKHPPPKPEEKKGALEEQPPQSTTGKLALPEVDTMPVRRKLAWDAESTTEDPQEQPTGDGEQERGKDKQIYVRELEKPDTQDKPKADSMKEGSESSSVTSGNGGRLPTPKLRELGIQRTHHDLTTPAVGGAVLVSPSKVKPSVPEQRKRASSQDGLDTLKKDLTKKGPHRVVSLLTSPAAGLKTVDPLPLREDCDASVSRFAEATLPVSKVPEHQTHTPGQPSTPCVLPYWHPSSRIQGCLRDPEFQHSAILVVAQCGCGRRGQCGRDELSSTKTDLATAAGEYQIWFFFLGYQLFTFELSVMACLQKSTSFSLMGTLAVSCLLLIALWAQEAEALPINSHCKLDVSNFQRPYFTNRTFMLAEEASLADNNTDVRLIGDELFRGVKMQDRCYLMKEVLNFTLEEVLSPQSDRFQPLMQEVVSFLTKLSNQLSLCHISGDGRRIQKNVQTMKKTVEEITCHSKVTPNTYTEASGISGYDEET